MSETKNRPALRSVTITASGNRKIYTINGLEYNQATVARLIHVNSATITARFRNNSRADVAEWLQVKFWLVDMGLKSKTMVFRRDDRLVLIIDIVDNAGINIESARNRGYSWQAGKISYDKMMLKKDAKANLNGARSRWTLKGMQPRKTVNDLSPAGTLEGKYLSPQSVEVQDRRGVVEHGCGYYTGRTF